MGYWHITLSSETRMPLFRSEARRRQAVCVLIEVLAGALILFCAADDHLHVVVVCSDEGLPHLRTTLWLALRPLAEAPLSSTHVKRVRDRRHLERLVGYFLRQTDHHGLSESLALYSGSCYPDLVGARRVEGFRPLLFELLPRWRPSDLHRIVDLGSAPLGPAADHAVRAAGAAHLVFAASMSTAADPLLRGNGSRVVLARTVAARLGAAVGIARAELAWALDVTPRALRRIEERPVAPEQVDAARRCIALIDRVLPDAATCRLAVGRSAAR